MDKTVKSFIHILNVTIIKPLYCFNFFYIARNSYELAYNGINLKAHDVHVYLTVCWTLFVRNMLWLL